MFDRWDGHTPRVDRRYLLTMAVVPGVATIGAMAVTFTLAGVILLVREGLIVGSLWTRLLALVGMYLLPQFAVGLWVGTRHGLAITPVLAAGIAPVIVLIGALGLFGGPILTPVFSPLLTLGAVTVWSLVCALGLLVGTKVIS